MGGKRYAKKQWRILRTQFRILILLIVFTSCLLMVLFACKKTKINKVYFSDEVLNLNISEEKSVEVKFEPQDIKQKELCWESTNETVAVVDSVGKIRGLEEGKCEVIASLKSDPDVRSSIEVIVSKKRDNWETVIVNLDNPVPSDWTVNIVSVAGNYVDERIEIPLRELIDAASKDGIDAGICSGYRSVSIQQELVNNSVSGFMDKGYSYDEAMELTSKQFAMPGHSEHNLGLAVDFYSDDSGLTESFADTDLGLWLKENAYKYGFILRYPKDKVDITKISYEPWHYRYVGVEYAQKIRDSGLCMEELF